MKFQLRLTLAILLSPALRADAQTPWHFEFVDGRPVKLVWQTDPGRIYNLRLSDSLLAWSQAPGFPKVAEGTRMEYPFIPAQRGYFDIKTAAPAGGGWQTATPPGLTAGSYFDFSAVTALNASQIWACGTIKPSGDACVVKSGDGGLTWSLLYRAGGVGFFGDIQMANSQTGYAAGGGLRRTGDGGTTWDIDQGNLPNPPGTWHGVGTDGYVYGLAVVDPDHVWTAGYDGASAGVIYHRVPERPQPDPLNPNANTPWWLEWAAASRAMYGISAVNAGTVWAVGYAGFIWKSSDGQGWVQQTSNTGVSLQDVDAVDAVTAWAAGNAGTILKTTDGGSTWQPQESGTTENLRRIAAVSNNIAWAVGTGGVILHTSDGGATWHPQFSGTAATLHGLAAVDAATAWVAGEGNILLRTSDGGTGTWPAPVISGVSPGVTGTYSEPPATLTIHGSGFRGGRSGVMIGGIPSENVTWINETTLQAAAPQGLTGTHDLTVANEDGQQATLSRAVTFVPPPVITRYTPLHGPAAGGYQITVEGYNLQSVVSAAIYPPGSQETFPAAVVDSTRVLINVPASATRPAGMVSLNLETAEHQSDSPGDFQFDPAGGPAFAIHSVSPAVTPAFLPFTVTVTGTGFTADTTLELCDREVTITERSATQLVGQAFGNNPGLCRLVARTGESGYTCIKPALLLTGSPLPAISQIAPATGPAGGGTSVTLTGNGFQATDTVTFGGYEATITSRTATAMVVTTPPHAPGAVSVFVMTKDLARSAAVLPGGFNYQ